ncbi:MAG: PAS domain S-box protein [Cyanobacteria bacterium P01_D01_bin.115]
MATTQESGEFLTDSAIVPQPPPADGRSADAHDAQPVEATNAVRSAAEQRYCSVIETQTELICRYQPDGTLTFVNGAYCRFFGRLPSDLIGLNFVELVPPEGQALIRQQMAELRQLTIDRPRLTHTHRAKAADGRLVWHQWVNQALFDEQGMLQELQATGRDITDLKATEQALRDREHQLSLFLTQSLDGFFFMMLDEPVWWNETCDQAATLDYIFTHQRVTKANSAIAQQYGLTKAEFLGLTLTDFFAEDIEGGKAIIQQLLDEGRQKINTLERRTDGTPIWIEGDYICLYDGQGRITGCFGIQRDVTGLQQTFAALTASEHKYRLLVENQTDLVVKIDVDGHFLFVSPSYCDLFDQSLDELLDRHFVPSVHVADQAATELAMAALWHPPYTCQLEQRAFTRHGWRWLSWSYKAVLDNDDNILAIVGVGRDVTQRKQTELQLQLSEQRFRQVLEGLTRVAIMLDRQGNIVFCNDYLLNLTGWQRAEVLHQNWGKCFLPPEIRPRMQALLQQVVEQGALPDQYFENEIMTRQGDRRLIAWNNTVQHDAQGRIISLTSIGEDITDRKRNEIALRETTQRLTLATEVAQIGIWEWDIQHDRLIWDEQMHRIYGTTAAQFAGRHADWEARVHPDDLSELTAQKSIFLQGQEAIFHNEFRIVRPDGEIRHIESYSNLVRDAAGQPACTIGVNWDISDRKASALALAETHQQLQALMQNSPAVMALYDETGRYHRVNPITEAFLQRPAAEIVGRRFDELYPPDMAARYRERVQRLVETNCPLVVEDHLMLMGENRIVRSILFPVLDQPGSPQLFGLIATDITALVTAREDLQRQAARERLLRELTGDIRSSLNLSAILDKTVNGVRQFLDTDRVLIYRFNPDWSGDMIVEAVLEPWLTVLGERLRDPCFEGHWVEHYRRGHIGQVNDLQTANLTPCHQNLLAHYQVQANVILPLVVDQTLWGLLCIHHCRSPRQWLAEDVAFVQQIAQQVEVAIQQAKLLQEMAIRARRERLRRLITQHIRQSLDLDVILTATVQEIRKFMGTDRVLIYRFHPDWTGEIVVESIHPEWIDVSTSQTKTPQLPETIIEQYRQGHITQIEQVQTADIPADYRQFLVQWQIQASLVFPLTIDGQLWGLLVLQHCRAPRPWPADEINFVQQIADQVEIAIQQSQLLQQTTIRAHREQLLNEIVTLMRDSLDLDAVIQRTIQKLLAEFKVGRCMFIQCGADDDYFEYAACATAPTLTDLTGGRMAVQDSPYILALLAQEPPMATSDVMAEPTLANLLPFLQQFQIGATLSVTIRYKGAVKGILCMHHPVPRQWTASEQILIKQVADQLAIALQQAELYQQAQTEIAERLRLEAQLRHDAFHDALTGLPNRTLLLDRLQLALQRYQRRHYDTLSADAVSPGAHDEFAVLFLDLDRFKVINDSLGHTFGDRLLRLVATRLSSCLRDVDIAARLGGDEFVILLEELVSVEFAVDVARRIHNVLEVPVLLDGQEIFVHVSIGIAFGASTYTAPEQILRNADIAMYEAKKSRQEYVVFDASMHAIALQQMTLENDLRHAIKRDQLRLHYQPIVSLSTGLIMGFEALVRWQHPTRGLLSPAAFVEIAEDTGLIAEIDLWVLRQSCQQLRCWHDRAPESADITLSVNLSGKQFSQPDLIHQIDHALHQARLAGKYLKLEITEGILITNNDLTVKTLNDFRARNIQVCMDDFGTGYSSLSYLHQLPVDVLKIDKSFILNLHSDSRSTRDYEIVKAIINLALNLNLQVIAEGVENRDVLIYLQKHKCHFGQGYHFAPAMTPEAATQMLLDQPFRLSEPLDTHCNIAY